MKKGFSYYLNFIGFLVLLFSTIIVSQKNMIRNKEGYGVVGDIVVTPSSSHSAIFSFDTNAYIDARFTISDSEDKIYFNEYLPNDNSHSLEIYNIPGGTQSGWKYEWGLTNSGSISNFVIGSYIDNISPTISDNEVTISLTFNEILDGIDLQARISEDDSFEVIPDIPTTPGEFQFSWSNLKIGKYDTAELKYSNFVYSIDDIDIDLTTPTIHVESEDSEYYQDNGKVTSLEIEFDNWIDLSSLDITSLEVLIKNNDDSSSERELDLDSFDIDSNKLVLKQELLDFEPSTFSLEINIFSDKLPNASFAHDEPDFLVIGQEDLIVASIGEVKAWDIDYPEVGIPGSLKEFEVFILNSKHINEDEFTLRYNNNCTSIASTDCDGASWVDYSDIVITSSDSSDSILEIQNPIEIEAGYLVVEVEGSYGQETDWTEISKEFGVPIEEGSLDPIIDDTSIDISYHRPDYNSNGVIDGVTFKLLDANQLLDFDLVEIGFDSNGVEEKLPAEVTSGNPGDSEIDITLDSSSSYDELTFGETKIWVYATLNNGVNDRSWNRHVVTSELEFEESTIDFDDSTPDAIKSTENGTLELEFLVKRNDGVSNIRLVNDNDEVVASWLHSEFSWVDENQLINATTTNVPKYVTQSGWKLQLINHENEIVAIDGEIIIGDFLIK